MIRGLATTIGGYCRTVVATAIQTRLSIDLRPMPRSGDWKFIKAGMAGLILLTIGLRLIPIVVVPSIVWPDEIFQTLEQAHRLVYGTGLVPWEFQLGIRSWLLSGLIAALMELSRIAGDGPDYYIPLIAGSFAALAAAPVVCSFLWGRRLFGLFGGWIAAAVVAVAPRPCISVPAPSPKPSPLTC